jgi:hypothetical protein
MYIVQTVVRFRNQVQLQLFVGGLMSYLRCLCLLRIAVSNTYCVVLFAVLVIVLCAQCCQFLWIVYS